MFQPCSVLSLKPLWYLSVILVGVNTFDYGLKYPEFSLLKLSLADRIRHYGYPVELHEVTTEDGYILSLYRVPRGVNESAEKAENRSVVLILHGLGGDPRNFFLLGHDSIALSLVQQGFDVWVLCFRGMKCAQKKFHVTLDRDKDDLFWKYTLNELGYYDLPAAMDFITAKTGQEKLFLLGHSAGCTLEFIFLSQRPEYNDRVKIATSYAGTVFLSQTSFPLLKFFSSLVKLGKGIWSKVLKLYQFVPTDITIWLTEFVTLTCNQNQFRKACFAGMSFIGTHRSVLIDAERYLPFIIQGGTFRLSVMQIFQYADILNSGRFIKYDYGKANMKYYGQSLPPIYNLSAVTCPTAFFYASNDGIATIADTKRIMSHLPNVVLDFLVPFKKFNHIDFIYGSNASKLVYEPTYELFKNYDKGIIPPKVKSNWRKRFVNKRKTF